MTHTQTDEPVNTLKLGHKVSVLTSRSLFRFESNVLEHRANTTKHVSLLLHFLTAADMCVKDGEASEG